MPLTLDQKRELAERLLRGEDVTLTTDSTQETPHPQGPADDVPAQAVVDGLARTVAQQAVRIAVLEAQLGHVRAHG